MEQRENGIINAYDPFKGFGFIRREKGKDVFFLFDEALSVVGELTVGDLVSFEVEMKPRGPRAKNIEKSKHLIEL
ncbi:retron Se72 family effector protein [Psychromonas ossibalaenae]|uniref:retron Se72 family effector protein n=1 Tax=Psychromonas ossibalaenae TaxID=444922 RepID=UPI0003612E18|nr:retron Se72 family effector protein [Psychromonas ossibalaenae]